MELRLAEKEIAMGFKPDIHIFNEGKSRVILNWSPVAQAYYVYREDGIHLPQSTHSQGNLVSITNLMPPSVITKSAWASSLKWRQCNDQLQ
jgi:hypothetical protein